MSWANPDLVSPTSEASSARPRRSGAAYLGADMGWRGESELMVTSLSDGQAAGCGGIHKHAPKHLARREMTTVIFWVWDLELHAAAALDSARGMRAATCQRLRPEWRSTKRIPGSCCTLCASTGVCDRSRTRARGLDPGSDPSSRELPPMKV